MDMRVKITQPGWETYTGPLFGVHFENAVSQTTLRRDQALQLGAMVSTVEVDEDGNELGPVSPSHEMVKNQSVSAEVVEPMAFDDAGNDGVAGADDTDVISGEPGEDAIDDPADETESKVYTEAELIEVADTKGINGLREIGEPLGVKNTSIRGLIREILTAQNGQ